MDQCKQQDNDDNDNVQAYSTYSTVFHAVVLVSFIHHSYTQGLVNYVLQDFELCLVPMV